MIKQFLTIFLLFILHTISFAQDLDNFFSTLHQSDIFNGSIAIATNNRQVIAKYYGYSNIEKKEKVTNKTQYPIASITKTFTSTAILQLKQNGKLSIDDPVKKYLSNFPYPNISIRHLLNNTSGLTQYYTMFDSIIRAQPDRIISNQDIIPALSSSKVSLSFDPGTKWEYNNVNFCLAALIIEKVSGLTYSNYLDKYIFKPAKMSNSFVPKNRKIKTKNQVELYNYPNTYSTNRINIDSLKSPFLIDTKSNFYGNGGIVSTTDDLFKYQKALFANQLLGKKEIEEALTATKLNDNKMVSFNLEGKEASYGLGWFLFTNESEGKVVFHDGSIFGLTSILMHNIDKNQTTILLSNTGGSPVFSLSHALMQLINKKPYTLPAPSLSRSYGSILEMGNQLKANELILKYSQNPSSYNVTERDFIRMGYEFPASQKTDNALQTFKSATILFPDSWNAYDSYGEALLKSGKKEEGIKMYQKSLELNPDNKNGKKVLDDLLK
jgi:CubicO group peptidase (beta-lactamase class C family)